MASRRITLIMEGSESDQGHLRFGVYLRQLQALSATLKQIDRAVTSQQKRTAYYRVIDLSHSSPATIVVEAVPLKPEFDYTEEITRRLFADFEAIKQKETLPDDFDSRHLESFKALLDPVGKTISSAILKSDDQDIVLDEVLKAQVDLLLAPRDYAQGSIQGVLEAINIHLDINKFRIYPEIGPKVIVCHFSESQKGEAVTSVGRFVRVVGRMTYPSVDRFPYRIEVETLEQMPDEQDIPHFLDMLGAAPDATGDQSSEDFVRELRDGWD